MRVILVPWPVALLVATGCVDLEAPPCVATACVDADGGIQQADAARATPDAPERPEVSGEVAMDAPPDRTADMPPAPPPDVRLEVAPDLPPDSPTDLPRDLRPDSPALAPDAPPDTPPDLPPDLPLDLAKRPQGTACGAAFECATGFCVSGFCCNTECTDSCSVCNLPSALGTCSSRPISTLVGHWRFDESSGTTARDATCNGNTATLREYAAPDWRAGRTGNALSFDGANQWVSVPASPSLDSITSRVTLAAWVRPTDNMGWGNVMTRQYLDTAGEHYGLSTFANRPLLYIGAPSAKWCESTAPTALRTDRWTHLAATYDGNVGRLYVDGVEVCTIAHTTSFLAETKPLVIGGNSNNATDDAQELFRGLLDDVLVYSRALGAAEIQSLATGGLPPQQ